jgi:Spx/MgsR family transcriptional regulator
MLTIYGIKNCGTMRKAMAWLDEHGIEYRFHDYKRDGLDEARLRAWIDNVGWEPLLNRRGQMWRKLPEEVRAAMDEPTAVRVILETPSIIRRPILERGGELHLGFSEDDYERLLKPPID